MDSDRIKLFDLAHELGIRAVDLQRLGKKAGVHRTTLDTTLTKAEAQRIREYSTAKVQRRAEVAARIEELERLRKDAEAKGHIWRHTSSDAAAELDQLIAKYAEDLE